ncbi:hypothetical protein C8R46DRAFT_1059280 [Mycena filopes]|nr:hypothetical protein C8R46DRAFT_1059280 [Mycena filopes]
MEDNDAEGETDEDADDMDSDEDTDAESDSDFEPALPQSSDARATIPLPHRRNAPAAAPSTISLQARDDDEYEGEETSEPEDDDDDDKDGDYGVRARPSRSAPPAKRRRDNAGAAIAVPKRRVAGVKKGVAKKKTETQLEYEILPADTVQPTARKAADGLYHCSVAGCPKSYKEPSGLSHHWSVHIPKKIPCPACGRKFDKNRKTSIERHLQSQKGCPASKAEKEEGLKELVTSMKKRSNA